jgi:single-stranded DNA-binding protein
VLSILASGQLLNDPTERTSRNARPYVTCGMRCPTEDADAVLVSLIGFSESARQALAALAKGDQLAVSGRAKLTSWERDGQRQFGMSVIVETVLSLYALEKRRARAAAKPAEAEAERVRSAQAVGALALQDTSGGVAGLADDLGPWGGS